MVDVEYKIGVKSAHADESSHFSGWIKSEHALEDRLVKQLHGMKGPFEIRPRNGKFGPPKSAGEVARVASNILHDGHPTFVVIRGDGARQVIVRGAIAQPNLADTDGNARVDAMHTAVWARFKGKVSSFGICSCRSIAGSSEWSQHAYCNAEDIHGSAKVMEQVAAFLVHNAKGLNVDNTIYNRRIWNPGAGWHPYTGENPHTDHVHVDFLPEQHGTPPCAR